MEKEDAKIKKIYTNDIYHLGAKYTENNMMYINHDNHKNSNINNMLIKKVIEMHKNKYIVYL